MNRTRTHRISIRFFLYIKALIIWCNKEGHFLLVNATDPHSTTRLINNRIVLLNKAKDHKTKLTDNSGLLSIEECQILITFNNKDQDKVWEGWIWIYKVKWDLSKIYLIKDPKACQTIWVVRWIRVVNRYNNLSSPNSE